MKKKKSGKISIIETSFEKSALTINSRTLGSSFFTIDSNQPLGPSQNSASSASDISAPSLGVNFELCLFFFCTLNRIDLAREITPLLRDVVRDEVQPQLQTLPTNVETLLAAGSAQQ